MVIRRAVCLRNSLVRFCGGLGGNWISGSHLVYPTLLESSNPFKNQEIILQFLKVYNKMSVKLSNYFKLIYTYNLSVILLFFK